MDHLGRLDLNLLVTLDALLAELNVTRAADRLHRSQPAVSLQLSRLRRFFDDPLLVPGPRGMRPTARAEALREPVRAALAALDAAVAPSGPFDPATARNTWRVAASDYSAMTAMLPVLATLRETAPQTRLAVVRSVPARLALRADRGDIDLAFHTRHDAPPGLHHRTLFAERYVLVGRDDHPALKRRPSVARFSTLEHLIVSPDGGGFHGVGDEALAAIGLVRRVVVSVPDFLLAPAVLARTDLVALLPRRLVRDIAGLRIVEPPVDVPGYEIALLWPERLHRDPAHRWLRDRIARGAA